MAVSVARTPITVDSTSWTVNIPSPSSGDLLIVGASVDGQSGVTVTWPAGFSRLVEEGGSPNLDVAYKVCTGLEGSTIALTISANEKGACHAYLIPAAEWNVASNPEAGTPAFVNLGVTIDIPSLNPSGWGVENTLWIIMAAADSFNITGVSSYPTNYTSTGIYDQSGSGSNVNSGLASAYRFNSAASEDPGILTWSGTDDSSWGVLIAVRPGTGGATTTPQSLIVTATGVVTLESIQVIELPRAIAVGVASMLRSSTFLQSLAGTAIGVATLSSASVIGQVLSAVAIGVASLASLVLDTTVQQALNAVAICQASLAHSSTRLKTMASTALGVATLSRKITIKQVLSAVALGVLTLSTLEIPFVSGAVNTMMAIVARRRRRR